MTRKKTPPKLMYVEGGDEEGENDDLEETGRCVGSAASSGSRVAPFIAKLYAMLTNPAFQGTCSFDASGTTFQIFNARAFTEDVLPQFYKHGRMRSFTRQLNQYSFWKGWGGTCELGAPAQYRHPSFVRGRPDWLGRIARRPTGVAPPPPEGEPFGPGGGARRRCGVGVGVGVGSSIGAASPSSSSSTTSTTSTTSRSAIVGTKRTKREAAASVTEEAGSDGEVARAAPRKQRRRVPPSWASAVEASDDDDDLASWHAAAADAEGLASLAGGLLHAEGFCGDEFDVLAAGGDGEDAAMAEMCKAVTAHDVSNAYGALFPEVFLRDVLGFSPSLSRATPFVGGNMPHFAPWPFAAPPGRGPLAAASAAAAAFPGLPAAFQPAWPAPQKPARRPTAPLSAAVHPGSKFCGSSGSSLDNSGFSRSLDNSGFNSSLDSSNFSRILDNSGFSAPSENGDEDEEKEAAATEAKAASQFCAAQRFAAV